MPSPINTLPIQSFLQQLKSAELSQAKEIKLDIKSARALAVCLADVNAKLLEDYDKLLTEIRENKGSTSSAVDSSFQMDGGGFSNN
jgi:hypothetical protein